MTEKQKLIEAFKSLDFDALQNLLDDGRSYMDVPKDLFLFTLKQKIDDYEGLKSYQNVVEGTCNSCNKGCIAYKFKAENLPSLTLFFEENDGEVTDIYLCNDFKEDSPDEDDEIYFSFYEEDKVDFEPSLEYLLALQRVEKAVEAFNNLEKTGIVPIEEVILWYNTSMPFERELELSNPFTGIAYKADQHLGSISGMVSRLIHNFKNNDLAKMALDKYYKMDRKDERSLVEWLIENRENYFFELKKTDNWEKTGFLILETNPNLLVDCNGYLDGFLLDEIYSSHMKEIMEKYQAANKDPERNGGSKEFSLEGYLRILNN